VNESVNVNNSSPTHPRLASLTSKHRQLELRLEELQARLHLTLEEEYEEAKLKKQKLALKDEMQKLQRQKTQ
jgi:uncharacterized protein YdcH (DUF465 family)